jgi:hypothetical protein
MVNGKRSLPILEMTPAELVSKPELKLSWKLRINLESL